MGITRVNFATDGTGQNTTGALRTLDNNCLDLDSRVTTAQSTANAAVPSTGGIVSGALQVRGGLLAYGSPAFVSGGGYAFGWNGIYSGACDSYCFNNGGTGGFIYKTLNSNNSAIVGTFGFDPTGAILSAYMPAFRAGSDNATDLGTSSLRFKNIFASNAAVQTSDRNSKDGIVDTVLGLDFVMALRPVSYTMRVGHNKVEEVQVGTREETIVDVDGNEQVITVPVTEHRVTPVPGKRLHEGLIAQEVAAALTTAGVDPETRALWTRDDPNDPDSRQGLRYEELIGPLIKAVQQLAARVVALEQGGAAEAHV